MKRILCFILALVFLLMFVACDSIPDIPSILDGIKGSGDNNTQNNGGNDDPSQGGPDQVVGIAQYLAMLLDEYIWTPEEQIPETLRVGYHGNLVDPSTLTNDYSSFVSVSNIPKNGIGPQWDMVSSRISQADMFYKVLGVVDTLSTASVIAFNAFIDKNPADTAFYQFESGIYTVTIQCTKDTIYYVIDYTANISSLGEQSVQVALSMDIQTRVKNVRVQIGDANVMKYTMQPNKYTLAVKLLEYGSAYFELVENADGSVSGQYYEHVSADSIDVTASSANFYVANGYLTVVGNKLTDLLEAEGTTCEIYSASTGKMIAYEVKEKLLYDVLWFDVEDISGINSIKYVEKDEEFFVNGSSKAWEAATSGAIVKIRKFDIEFRTQYFYYYDAANDSYEKVAVKVPMMFVNEDYLSSFASDVSSKNGISASINISSTDISKLMSEYASKSEALDQNKGSHSADDIANYIGVKKTFS